MTFRRIRTLALLLATMPAPALAQSLYQPAGMSDADALASAMRLLGSNPRNLDALLTAGELSVRLEDLSAAASFFARAEKIDPRSGRAKAGEGAIMVRSQRPAEALRLFAQAEQLGQPVARFASDRGLAYDLLGDLGRAQRDYRLALGAVPDAETRRRFALSLGIAGRQAQALDELEPLIRSNDRAAWRTRAFVLAMGGDAAEASRIAQTMMPPGAAAGLRSFFAELPRLSPVDRAFAVHFGEVRPSAVRLADARLAPREAPLALEPLPVRVAAVQPPALSRKQKRDRRKRNEQQLAALLPAPAPTPAVQPPAYQAPAFYPPVAATTPVRDRPLTAGEMASLTRAGLRNVPRASTPARSYTPPAPVRDLTGAEQASLAAATGAPVVRREPPVVLAALTPPVRSPAAIVPSPVPRPITAPVLAPAPIAPAPVALASAAPVVASPTLAPAPAAAVPSVSLAQTDVTPRAPAVVAAAALPTPGFSSTFPTALTSSPIPTASPPAAVAISSPPIVAETLTATPPVQIAAVPRSIGTATPGAAAVLPSAVAPLPEVASASPTPAPLAAAPTATVALVTPPPAPAVAARPPVPRRLARGEGDSILAKIVAQLTIPASELEVAGPAPAAGALPSRTAARRLAAEKAATEEKVADKAAADKKAGADKKALAAKSAADKKALAEKKAAADKKALADKEAAAENKLARSEPKRIWVQVAGGANESDLAKAWRSAQAKAPQLAGKSGWTAPLRSTNRVLTGPYKTDAEARAAVNQLAKAGVSAFTFTSDPGQKITRLAAK